MADVEKIKEIMEDAKENIEGEVEDFVDAAKDRLDKIEKEAEAIRDSIGEEIQEKVLWLKSNKMIVAVAAVSFFVGAALGSLSGIM
jgi:vacuolar-type H+-ATPase subunit H